MRQYFVSGLLLVTSLSTLSCKNRNPSSSEVLDESLEEKISQTTQYLEWAIEQYDLNPTDKDRKNLAFKSWDKILQFRDHPEALHKISVNLAVKAKMASQVIYNTIKTEMENRGKFTSWDSLVGTLDEIAGEPAIDLKLISELERFAGSPFLSLAPGWKILNKGRPSWLIRDKLMKNATKSIWIFSWAFYDDKTGREAATTLINKAKAGLDVRVVVDGTVSLRKGLKEPIEGMMANGVKVIRWSHPKMFGFGMHRKMMIVDHELPSGRVVFGGKNFGDNYSHLKKAIAKNASIEEQKRDTLERWRDTDMLLSGLPVIQSAHLFAKAWNSFFIDVVTTSDFDSVVDPGKAVENSGSDKIILVDHNPSLNDNLKFFDDPIYKITLKMIASARSKIDISNAYFILTKPLQDQLIKAMNRGVAIRIHTNSESSLAVDDKLLLGPINRSLRSLLNVEDSSRTAAFVDPTIYLQKDRTLHSKYLVVDGKFGWLGSYNIHPRSSRYESESVGMFYGAKIGQAMQEMFNEDISNDRAEPKFSQDDLKIPKSQLFDLLEAFIFEQL